MQPVVISPRAHPIRIRLANSATVDRPRLKQIEAIEPERKDAEKDSDDRRLQGSHNERRSDIFARAYRRNENVEQIARPNIIEKRDADAVLRPIKNVPQDYRGNQKRHSRRHCIAAFMIHRLVNPQTSRSMAGQKKTSIARNVLRDQNVRVLQD